ncbi:MAG: hypothetical protein LBR74_02460, partial [Eubacterium sp.]|nr:hypothetical protein [Eubacterium sp.]
MAVMINFHAVLNYFLKTQQRTTFYERLLYYYQYNLDNDRYIENFHNDGYGLIAGTIPVEVQDRFRAVETISLAGMLKQSTKTIFEEAGMYSRNTHSLVLKTLSE